MPRPIETTRSAATRRGSTIIFVVGVLAVLALVAVTYTTVVRLDRSSAASYANRVDFNQQAAGVVGEIQALLTADLYGNKIVTAEVPQRVDSQDPTAASIWPTAFEDGEHYDYPYVDINPATMTFHDPEAGPIDSPAAPWTLGYNATFSPQTPFFEAATKRDDAWLSSTEPVDTTGDQLPDTWPQITNLRSAYRWIAPEAGESLTAGFWARDDGRFVDLAQWFLQEDPQSPGRGDPNADLFDFEYAGIADQTLGVVQNIPALAVRQQVFPYQLHQLALTGPTETLDQPVFEAVDQRYWADADGDLRPDSRWTQLDVLGDLYGLKWVVAARIIDNSSMVNVNSSLELADSMTNTVGDARTPADIDLYRLLLNAARRGDWTTAGAWTTDAELDPVNVANFTSIGFEEHLTLGLGLDALIQSEVDSEVITPIEERRYPNLQSYTPGMALSRVQRRAVWEQFGAAPLDRRSSAATPYPISDETDLRAFHAVNFDSLIAKFEQRLDAGNLPGQPGYTSQGNLGPTRAAEPEGGARVLLSAADAARPSREQLRDDTRRLLTVVSGVSDYAPIPPLNRGLGLDGITPAVSGAPVRKVALESFFGVTGETAGMTAAELQPRYDLIDSAFGAFMWALAPLASDTPAYPALSEGSIATLYSYASDHNAHYGGGVSGPAQRWAQSVSTTTGTIGAAYATHRALALAVNLADATDLESGSEVPTVARFYNDRFARARLARDINRTDFPISRVAVLDSRFPHADLPEVNNSAALPTELFGGIGDPNFAPLGSEPPPPPSGVTVVGLDTQPFLIEAVTVSVYKRRVVSGGLIPIGPVEGIGGETIDPDADADQVGSIFAVELGNPFDRPIDLTNYRVRLASSAPAHIEFLFDGAGGIDDTAGRGTLDAAIIPPGERTIFVFHRYNDAMSPEEWLGAGASVGFLDTWLDAVKDQADITNLNIVVYEAGQNVAEGENISEYMGFTGAPPELAPTMYQRFPTTGDVTVQLIRELPDVVYNQAQGQAGGTPTRLLIDRMRVEPQQGVSFPAAARAHISVNVDPNTQDSGYAYVAANITRPTSQHADGGFPWFVIERPQVNISVESAVASEAWSTEAEPNGRPYINDIAQITDGDFSQLGKLEKSNNAQADSIAPAFQLFVPNSRIYSTAELGMLSPFAHVYVHPAGQPGNDPPDIDAAREAFLAGEAIGIPTAGRWVTVSEQLGVDHHLAYDTAQVVSAANLNPYTGALDLSRFILTDDGSADLAGVSGVPDSFAVPLATRVFDCFEANYTRSRLVSGRVNVNTATERVLRALPYVDPAGPTSVLANDAGLDLRRHTRIAAYRDGLDLLAGSLSLNFTPSVRTGLTNRASLRASNYAPTAGSPAPHPGIASLGELAVLGRFVSDLDNMQTAHQIPPSPEEDSGFLFAARPGSGNPLPLDPQGASGSPMDIRPQIIQGYDPTDDAEERLALFRGLTSTAATRSDIFTAWFVLRGYDPAQIEAQITDSLDDEQKTRLLNELTPAYSARWLAVLDRSNVNSPRERPRILLLVEVPEN